eukprot:scaffold4698_cov48-Phaeocystis_antarctica.AAC.1
MRWATRRSGLHLRRQTTTAASASAFTSASASATTAASASAPASTTTAAFASTETRAINIAVITATTAATVVAAAAAADTAAAAAVAAATTATTTTTTTTAAASTAAAIAGSAAATAYDAAATAAATQQISLHLEASTEAQIVDAALDEQRRCRLLHDLDDLCIEVVELHDLDYVEGVEDAFSSLVEHDLPIARRHHLKTSPPVDRAGHKQRVFNSDVSFYQVVCLSVHVLHGASTSPTNNVADADEAQEWCC